MRKEHLALAHKIWTSTVTRDDIVIDATCGNGQDTLFLASLGPKALYALDIQFEALEATKQRLQPYPIHLVHGCHSSFPGELSASSVKLIVYNLGYLPGGNKQITTTYETTLKSLEKAQILLQPGGLLSITCYPGHPAGVIEEHHLLNWASNLNRKFWSVCHHRWLNKPKSPHILIITKY